MLAVVRLPPAEAMRPPSPPSFRPALFERLGRARAFTPQTRMIVRNIERMPLRFALTSFAVASGVAILVAGTWWRDAVDYLLDVEFRLRERQHVTLAFTDPVSAASLHELAHMPGVLQVEGAREAQVRFRYGHRSHRTTVIGVPQGAAMRKLLDARLSAVEVPPYGVVMSERLAAKLDATRGDEVWIEFLEGERRDAPVQVVGIVPELVERRGYMDRDALSRLAGEGDSYTSARIWLDHGERAAFFAQVKQTPKIAAVAEVGPVMANFRQTSGRFILVFTGMLSIFAAVIAVGVVYNNARIALAERAWELASLRVLGFTRGEVSALLLGELALEMLLALPLGWVLGYWLSYGIVQLIQTETFALPVIIAPRTYAYATIVTVLAGVASALIVRRRVDTLDLTAVLKTRE
jgi:putative ABC transport system permease protein